MRDEIFKSREDMMNWVKGVGLENNIIVVIKNSTKLKGGKLPRCHLICERGGKYKPSRYLIDGQSITKNTGTKNVNIPLSCEVYQYLRMVLVGFKGYLWFP